MKLRSLAKLGVDPSIFSGNEARLHLLADIITLDRQEEAVLVLMSLAEAIRHEAFTQTHRANSLQFSLEVGIYLHVT